jgi:hypothetical protein
MRILTVAGLSTIYAQVSWRCTRCNRDHYTLIQPQFSDAEHRTTTVTEKAHDAKNDSAPAHPRHLTAPQDDPRTPHLPISGACMVGDGVPRHAARWGRGLTERHDDRSQTTTELPTFRCINTPKRGADILRLRARKLLRPVLSARRTIPVTSPSSASAGARRMVAPRVGRQLLRMPRNLRGRP